MTSSLLERHNPAHGLAVVHPTPATSSPTALAYDVLVALDRPVSRLEAEHLTGTARPWQAAAVWMTTDQVKDLIVLRAERLSASTWNHLIRLCRDTGSRLTLVCHTRQIPEHLRGVLTGIEHHLLTDLAQARTLHKKAHPPPLSTEPRSGRQDTDQLPDLPAAGVAHFRAEAYRRLDPAAFARVDAAYRYGRHRAYDWLSGPAPEETYAGTEHAQLFLTGLVHDSPTRAHTLARLRGAQAGFLAHGLLLGVPSAHDLMNVLSGPGLNTLPVSQDALQRIRTGVAHPMVAAGVATALFTGISTQATRHATLADQHPNPAALRVTWRPHITKTTPNLINQTAPTLSTPALFHVPAAARPLLRAAADFALRQPSAAARERIFAPPAVTNERVQAAADHCQIALPVQAPTLEATWQIRVTCTQINAPPVHAAPSHPTGQPPLSRVLGQPIRPASARRGYLKPAVNGHAHDRWHGRRPLTEHTAALVLDLIHDHLASPAPSDRNERSSGPSWMLIRRQLACYPRDPDGNLTALSPHPDVLYALELTDRPAQTVPDRARVIHEDQ
nr:AAA domain protein [Arthrobacter sp.]